MVNNFCKAVAEIWRLQQKHLYAVGLYSKSRPDTYGDGFLQSVMTRVKNACGCRKIHGRLRIPHAEDADETHNRAAR